jgi:3-oxoacyl-[acyl-carrier protein] reductase
MEGRAALVTGGAGGIGAATGLRMAQDGFNVALLDLNEDSATSTAEKIADAVPGRKVIGVGCDVSDAASVADAVAKVQSDLGGLHIAVNNAGVTRDNLIHKMTEDDWDTVIAVHLRGCFLVCRAVQAPMVANGWGRIVNISSINAHGARGQANYSAAKMGIQGLTRTLAIELGPKGITVNCVAPGFVQTPRTPPPGGSASPKTSRT